MCRTREASAVCALVCASRSEESEDWENGLGWTTLLLGLISHQSGSTAFWILFSCPDRERSTLHGWWPPVAQHYKGRWGPELVG
jgi:hypothetical protein